MERLPHAGATQGGLEHAIARLASQQHGVFSRAQAKAIGLSNEAIRWRVSKGRWERVYRDVFRIGGTPGSGRQIFMSAFLGWGRDAVISFTSATAFWQLTDAPSPSEVELIVDRKRRLKGFPAKIHWIGPLAETDFIVEDSIPVTTPSRTLVDVASVLPEETLEEALDAALRRKLTSTTRMRWQLARGGERRGIAVLRALINARDPSTRPSESVLETKVARILRKAKLPGLVQQHDVVFAGRVVARLDFAFPVAKVAIEADGYRWHSGHTRWRRDLARRNALTNLGWRIIHVTWSDLNQPQAIVDQVEQALRARLF